MKPCLYSAGLTLLLLAGALADLQHGQERVPNLILRERLLRNIPRPASHARALRRSEERKLASRESLVGASDLLPLPLQLRAYSNASWATTSASADACEEYDTADEVVESEECYEDDDEADCEEEVLESSSAAHSTSFSYTSYVAAGIASTTAGASAATEAAIDLVAATGTPTSTHAARTSSQSSTSPYAYGALTTNTSSLLPAAKSTNRSKTVHRPTHAKQSNSTAQSSSRTSAISKTLSTPANIAPDTLTVAAGCSRYHTVVAGEVCLGVLDGSRDLNLTLAELYEYNPAINDKCTNLQIGWALCTGKI